MNLKKKLAVFLAILFSLNLFAQAPGETITISFQNIPLSEAIKKIESVSKYTFFYDALKLNVDQKVSLNAQKTPIQQAISQMLGNSGIKFEIKQSQIILYNKNVSSDEKKISIRGNVTDVNGEPLIGVTVSVKDNPSIVTITNVDGIYDIKVPDKSAILQFKYIGFASREEAVNSRKIINVVLQDAATQLEDVVVVGYGVQKKASVVAAITSVKPQQLQVGTTRSLSNDLAGNIGGIIAVQRSGEPGYDNSEFWIRGMSSFKGSNSPLVLVDGVERSLNNLDISEIESFSVLKDASASAVYGVRGANGVILITTKRGHSGKTNINVSVEHSITRPAKLPSFLNAADYLTLLNNINIQETGTELYSPELIDKYRSGYDTELYPDIDWIDAITKDVAHNTRASFDLSGGNEKLRYSFVGAYYNEAGITESDKTQNWNSNISVNRFNLRTNVDMNVTSSTLLTFNIGGYLQQRNAPKDGIDDIFGAAFKATPYMVPLIYENGALPKPRENENPWAKLTQSGFKREAESKLETLFAVEQDLKCILPGLKIKGIFSYDYYSRNGVNRGKAPRYYSPATQRDPVTGELILTVLSEGDEFLGYERWEDYGNYSTYLEGNITYDQRFGNHSVSALLLYNQRNYDDGSQKRFAYITTIGTTDGYKWGNSNAFYDKGGLREGDPGVESLTWETVKKANVGIELGLFKMAELQVDFFHERREDIFMQRKNIPSSAGFPSAPWANYGIVTNKGFDISLDLNKQINKDWFISARASVTYAKNKIIEQDEDLGVLGTYRSSTGKPVGQIFGLVNDGLYTEADFEDVTTGKLKPGLPVPKFSDRVYPGDIKYVDFNGDGEITETDKTAIGGTVNPELVYGFGINLSYKNIDFGAFFQGNGRTYRIIGENQKNFLPGSTIGAEGNIFTNASDAWTVDNPSQDVFYPRLHMGYNANNAQVSDWWLKDMSMLRLKNVELGYSFSKNLIKKAAMEYARIFVRGTNLLQFSKFDLWDPELNTSNGLKYPIMATYSIGLQVRF